MNQVATTSNQSIATSGFSDQDIQTLKASYCKDLTDSEMKVFLLTCIKTQLDPLMKQVYAIKRGGRMTIQTSIDGYRLIAERTHRYCPGGEPTYHYDDSKNLISATAYIKKQTGDGTWHTVSASAYLDEYMQKDSSGRPMSLWAKMPRTMLAKCAESQALRKAFPAEMSGIYTNEEMSQAETGTMEAEIVSSEPEVQKISSFQLQVLNKLLSKVPAYHRYLVQYMYEKLKTNDLSQMPATWYDSVMKAASDALEAQNAQSKQIAQVQEEKNNSTVEEIIEE